MDGWAFTDIYMHTCIYVTSNSTVKTHRPPMRRAVGRDVKWGTGRGCPLRPHRIHPAACLWFDVLLVGKTCARVCGWFKTGQVNVTLRKFNHE